MKMAKYILPGVLLLLAIGAGTVQWDRRHDLERELKVIERSQAESISINDSGTQREVAAGTSADSSATNFQAREILAKASAEHRPLYLDSVEWQEMETAVFSLPAEEMPALLDDILGDGHRHVNSLIVQAIFEHWSSIDRDAAMARVETLPSSLWDGAYLGILTVWSEQDPGAAYAFAQSAPIDRESYKFTIEVLEMVAAHDSEAALELVGDDAFARDQVIRAWALADSESALEWVSKAENDGPIGELIGNLAARDVEAALAHAHALEPGIKQDTAIGAALGHWATGDFDAATTALHKALQTTSDPIRLLDEFADHITDIDAGRLMTLAEGLPEGTAREQFVKKITSGLSDPEIAIAMAGLIEHEGTYKDAISGLFREWSVRDPESASKYLTNMEPSATRDAAIETFTDGIIREDPESAMLWANTISDEGLRETHRNRLLYQWQLVDPDAAKAWRDQLSEE